MCISWSFHGALLKLERVVSGIGSSNFLLQWPVCEKWEAPTWKLVGQEKFFTCAKWCIHPKLCGFLSCLVSKNGLSHCTQSNCWDPAYGIDPCLLGLCHDWTSSQTGLLNHWYTRSPFTYLIFLSCQVVSKPWKHRYFNKVNLHQHFRKQHVFNKHLIFLTHSVIKMSISTLFQWKFCKWVYLPLDCYLLIHRWVTAWVTIIYGRKLFTVFFCFIHPEC